MASIYHKINVIDVNYSQLITKKMVKTNHHYSIINYYYIRVFAFLGMERDFLLKLLRLSVYALRFLVGRRSV